MIITEERLPYIVLDLDKRRRFRFDLNAVIEFQHATGMKLSEFDKLFPMVDKDAALLRTIIWAGLKQEDAELTEKRVGEICTWDKWADVSVAVVAYLKTALGVSDEDLKKELGAVQENESPGTGTPPSNQQPESV